MLEITHLKITQVEANPWNPNKQNDNQYQAEIQSIQDNGFIAPILVRKTGSTFQIIDGEHRWKALNEIMERGLDGKWNLPDLIKAKEIPAIVLEVNDAQAKKLTIIMNETRGQADLSALGLLLAEIAPDLGDTLGIGLPYSAPQLQELMAIADFNWEDYGSGVENQEFDTKGEEGYRVIALLDSDTQARWQNYLGEMKKELPADPKAQAGALIANLLNKAGK
jgi:hypothetical protein